MGELCGGVEEGDGPGWHGVDRAAVGVAGAVVQGKSAAGEVESISSGRGELLERGPGGDCSREGRGAGGVGTRGVQAGGQRGGLGRGRRQGRRALQVDDRARAAGGGAGLRAVVGDQAFRASKVIQRQAAGRTGGISGATPSAVSSP